ncbi:MAG: nicotinate-nucleotide--dimethylbenzimidazole phosphoribosyltransferase [Bacteroidia bacterium]
MKTHQITAPSNSMEAVLKHKIDLKTKPLGALGELEKIALQIGLIQNTTSPVLNNPHLLIFAADHGITKEGVSAYPQEVTYQMVLNFLNGGAAINIFCKQNNIAIKIIDAGVNGTFDHQHSTIIDAKIRMGTTNFLYAPAMTITEADECLQKGSDIVNQTFKNGCNIIGFGEMGIGNTTAASAIMSIICKLPVENCVGRGTGLNDNELPKKIETIKNAIVTNKLTATPMETLATFGGFEIAQMCGAMLQAAENKMVILIDGFIATAAFLIANSIHPLVKEYAIFCHQSNEQGHANMLHYLNVKPLLSLNMRLGEGTGVAIAYPIIEAAVAFLNDMASFESAGVSTKEIKELA